MKHRSKLDIYIDVLASISKGNNILSQIMNNANLSYLYLKNSLKSLEKQGYVSVTNTISKKSGKNKPVKYYEVTAKGTKILEYFRNVNDVILTGTKLINPFTEMINKQRSTHEPRTHG